MADRKLSATRAALAVYDAAEPARYNRLMDATTNEEVWAAVAAEKADADKVREAFASDTDDVNSRDRAFLVHPNDPWLRGQVEKSLDR